uniref:Peritrophin-1 n=1 Tax=Bactrocera latifrons TaxID=174628 RepID=A0A0K8W386_BACLA
MWCLVAFIAYLCGLSAGIEDLSEMLCSDVSNGAIVPNPRDCNSYFICGNVPMISYCDQGLHFDADNKVCNWPESANCQFKKINISTNKHTESQTTTSDYTISKELNLLKTELDSDVTGSDYMTPNELNLLKTELEPDESINLYAFDVNTRMPVDPMINYDPLNVACNHYGTYFLPHPNDCSSYYICAFGHMMQHKCGRGAGWNYKRQVCEVRPLTDCYAGGAYQTSSAQLNTEVELSTLFSSEQLFSNTPISEVCKACFGLTSQPPGPSVSSNVEATRFILAEPQRLPTSPTLGAVDIPELNVPNCPKNSQIYLPHATDCGKYYICIIGMPVLTSCPEGLYWNQTAELCDLTSNVVCP